MKRCPKNHDNPDYAKFCRICGYNFDSRFGNQLKNYWNTIVSFVTRMFNTMINEIEIQRASLEHSSGFTPDKFPSINLSPCSVAKVDFQCKKGVVFMVVMIILFALFCTFKYEIMSLLYHVGIPYDICDMAVVSVNLVLIFAFLIKFIPFLRRVWRWIRYRKNADYIEYSAFMQSLFRIAKKEKLGLFDKRKHTVKMGSHYDNISKFDSEHILIEKGGKKGLFSMKQMGLIVPIRFDRIDVFKNSIVKCHKGETAYYYDVNGNRMK